MGKLQAVLFIPLWVVSVGAQAPIPPPAVPLPKVDRSPRPGMGDLMVAPNRIIITERERTGELSLVNVGPRTATYRISFIQMDMAEDGALKEYTDKRPDGRYADTLIRFSPRQVTLEPGVAQVVRYSLRKSEGLVPGEYRSHMVFRAVPESDPVNQPQTDINPNEFSVSLIPVYGVAIPFIVRHGATKATIGFESARFLPGQFPKVEAYVARSGNQGIYFHLKAVFTPASGSTPLLVSQQNMLGIYDDVPRRRIEIPVPPEALQTKGTLVLTCTDPDTQRILAETKMELR